MPDPDQHIMSAFDRDLESLQAHFLKLSGLTEAALSDAAKALENLNIPLAEKIISSDTAIDELEEFIQMEAASLIARRGPRDFDEIAMPVDGVLDGLLAAHASGIIHRDLKPANVLIDDTGLLKIVDFGVAAAQHQGDTQLTKTGYVIGSPKYMAPEQILGKKVDERADVWSLGVVLYELVTGKRPFGINCCSNA